MAIEQSNADASGTNGFEYGAGAVGAGVIAVIALLIAAGNLTIRRRSQPEHTYGTKPRRHRHGRATSVCP